MTANDITVGQVAQRARMLDVRCSGCDRAGRLALSPLLLELGADAPIAQAWAGFNADCPRRDAQGAACSLHSPPLSALFLPPRPS